ncbi:MAG TPA: signal recognition particle subunit SRP19/SEC65 family protein [Candidatus Thalassarchaeaceae archaeon]|jgi:signal recognition particle subunit SRP19|nr:signal recognition particle subunit SRP19/SEC65 family protein [Candidatus Thalassarchaeaceae archaeon]MDP6844268.1 signal recognition particle subunit SRP19/SEC65 family protein [Candidatus Thalassarchaeaceae archaeon]HJM41143.1 signal recognition particle subunit SRP19/SEC65 family protein [Candidatus Thalassarchaeaceae archaeon]
MANHPDRIVVWPGYFDLKTSRRSGRRVSKNRSVVNPSLDGLAYAARSAGIRKMKREENTSHPSRPHAQEGRLWISTADALSATGADSKEGILQVIGSAWNSQQSEAKAAEKAAKTSGPKAGDKRGQSQRKSFKTAKGRKPSERRKRRK